MQILIDMDGPLTQFHQGALQALNALELWKDWPKGQYQIEEYLGIPIKEFWDTIEKIQNFWFNLQPQPWFKQLIDLLEQYGDFIVCTCPSTAPTCPTQKIEWMRKHIQSNFNNYMIGGKKYLMAGNGILIDDFEVNIESFVKAGGQAILFPMITNKNWKFAHDPIDYLRVRLNNLCL